MGTTNALFLNQRLHESVGDWLRVTATTNVAANVAITSTTLNQFDGSRDNYFTDWWVYVEDFLNAGVERKIKNYYTANGTALVYGTNLDNGRIGCYNLNGGGNAAFLTGNICEVRLYNRTLLPYEVLRNYLATKGRYQ